MIDASSLAIPAIAAPMTAISTPELVIAACNAGIVGTFPTGNCRSLDELDEWFGRIEEARTAAAGPLGVNLILHKTNARLDDDLTAVVRHGVSLVITSVGDPLPVIAPLHDAGVDVYVDVASMKHARRAAAAGADGLVLLSAGAGGHTGWANPFAFARAVRAFWDGPLVLAGGISDGVALWAAITLGYDLGYLGTKLIATHESGAGEGWSDAVLAGTLDDIALSTAPNGVTSSVLRHGDQVAGSAGHTVAGVTRVMGVAEVVAETKAEYDSARDRTRTLLT
ncbi:MAG: nitronate monooxygenase [Acidimicrobiia bacterium]